MQTVQEVRANCIRVCSHIPSEKYVMEYVAEIQGIPYTLSIAADIAKVLDVD